MHFQSTSGNNKYFAGTIPAGTFQPGDQVQYYFKIGYTDRQTTFLHGTDAKSSATADEAEAQADPFTFPVRFPLTASGAFLSFDSGSFQAHIFQASGHLAMAGPDLTAAPHANVVTIAPPQVESGDRTFNLGRVVSSTTLANGLDIVQQLGPRQVSSRLTFASDGVMQYEVVDWQGLTAADADAIARTLDGIPLDAAGLTLELYAGAWAKDAGRNVTLLLGRRGGSLHSHEPGFQTDAQRCPWPETDRCAEPLHSAHWPACFTAPVGFRRVDLIGHMAHWRRSALRGDQIPREEDSCFGVCFRFTLGGRLQRFCLQSNPVRPPGYIRERGVQRLQHGRGNDDLSPGERVEGHLLDDALR
jgi:hypothetical protein